VLVPYLYSLLTTLLAGCFEGLPSVENADAVDGAREIDESINLPARRALVERGCTYGLASPVYEMSSAPARLKMSFARVTSSPFSVWIDSRMLPDRTFPS
jgi:hypothetical protein